MAGLGDWAVEPLTPTFGVRLAQLDLRTIDSREVPALLRLVVKHRIVLLPNQNLDPSRQVFLTRLFGPAEPHRPHPSQVAGLPEVFRVASMAGDGHLGPGRYWHADGLISPLPPALVIFRIVQPPERGGETCFLDAAAAFRNLPRSTQAQLSEMTWPHVGGGDFSFVRRHPGTGDLALMVNLGRTGPATERSAALGEVLKELDDHCNRQPIYEHRWNQGDVIVADNLAVLHKASPVESTVRRVLDRTVVLTIDPSLWPVLKGAGDTPWS